MKKEQKPAGYWQVKENNHAEAQKYSSRTEYHKANSWACTIALKNGWLDEWLPVKPRADWNNKENCLEEAKKYKSKSEFAKNNPSAYGGTLRNGWLDECEFISTFEARSIAMSKPRKWTDKETICKAASKCDGLSDFFEKYPGAYNIAKKEGYLYDLFDKKKKERTYERFMEIARACETKSEIKSIDLSLYEKAKEEGWVEECDWIPEISRGPIKWTDENRLAAALKCKTRSEYQKRFPGAWKYDCENGLMDRYTHFIKPVREGRDPNATDYVIYIYPDYENKVVYVGLTYEERKKKRHCEHVYGRKEKDGTTTFDVVAAYWKSIGKPMPDPVYVKEGLNINEVGYFEGWYMDYYRKEGWTVLNIAKPGSTGGAKMKWNTYEAVAEKSKEYDTRGKFCKGCGAAAKKARTTYTDDGILWIDTFYWLRDSHEVRSESSKKRVDPQKVSEIRSMPIDCYDLYGNYVKKYKSQVEAKNELGNIGISSALSGRKTAGGFLWRKAGEPLGLSNEELEILRNNENRKTNEERKLLIIETDVNMMFIQSYSGLGEASESKGVSKGSIHAAIFKTTKYGDRRKCKGHYFMLKSEYDSITSVA